MTSLFSPKPSIRSRPSRNGGLGGFVQVEVLAEEYGCSPTEPKEKRSSMINLFEKKRKRKSAPPPLAISLAQQGFVESAVTTGESIGSSEEVRTPPVPKLPQSPLRSVSSPLVTMWKRRDKEECPATDRDSTEVQIGEVQGHDNTSPPVSEISENDTRKNDGGPRRQDSRADTLVVTLAGARRSTPSSPLTPQAERDSYMHPQLHRQHSLHLHIQPTSPGGSFLPTPLEKALPPLPPDSIEVIKHLLEPIELPGSILLPNQGFDFQSLVPDQLSVTTVKSTSSESSDDGGSIYSRTTSGSLPSLSVDSSPENKMGKFTSPQKNDRQILITAPVESLENMDMEQLLNELPNYTSSTVSTMWLPTMKTRVTKEIQQRKSLEDKVKSITQLWAESSLNDTQNTPIPTFLQYLQEIKLSAQESAAKHCEAALEKTPMLDAKIEQLSKDLEQARDDLQTAYAVIDENRGCILDQNGLIGKLHETYDAHLEVLAKFVVRHAHAALATDKSDYLTRKTCEIMQDYVPLATSNDELDALPPLPESPFKSNKSSPIKSGVASPFRSRPVSPVHPALRHLQISEDEYITLRYENREMQSNLLGYKQLAADQKDIIRKLSDKLDGYLEKVEQHAETEKLQKKELGHLRNEVKLFKKDIKGYKEDEKLHQETKAAMDQLALDKSTVDEEVQKLKQTLLSKEVEASNLRIEVEKLSKENAENDRPSSAVSQVSTASLISSQSAFAKSIPKVWQSTSHNERNRDKDNTSQKKPNVLRRGQSSTSNTKKKSLTIDTNVTGHTRSRSQSSGGFGMFGRKLPASKSMVQISSPKIVSSETTASQQHNSQQDSAGRTLQIIAIGPVDQGSHGRGVAKSPSDTDEEMAKQMAFYGITSSANSRDLPVRESSYAKPMQKPSSEAQSQTERWVMDEPGTARLRNDPQDVSLPKVVSSPKARNILGIRERSDSLKAPKMPTRSIKSSKTAISPLTAQNSHSSQHSVTSKASSMGSGTSKSTTSKKSNKGTICGIGTAVKLKRGDPHLTTILDKKLPSPPDNTPQKKLGHRRSRCDTLRAPATAPLLAPSNMKEHLDLDPLKRQHVPQVSDRYPSGGVLDSPLKTAISERYPSQGILTPSFLRPQELTKSPYSDGSLGDKKVEVDESDYNDGSPAQHTLRRKRALGRSKAASFSESPTQTPKASKKVRQEPSTPETLHNETMVLGRRSMNLLAAIDRHGYHESPDHEHPQSTGDLLTSLSPDVHKQSVLFPTVTSEEEENEENFDFDAFQRRPPIPERNHRRILSRVTESYELEDEEDEEQASKGTLETESEYAADESGFDEIGHGEHAEVLPFVHVSSRKLPARYVTN
ncbi:MAG: hypothetical protein Q9160_000822 [Pyrenula sp. 1 TL-2023]